MVLEDSCVDQDSRRVLPSGDWLGLQYGQTSHAPCLVKGVLLHRVPRSKGDREIVCITKKRLGVDQYSHMLFL